jgi:uncharacterized repeat protein (TIGR02543 family)
MEKRTTHISAIFALVACGIALLTTLFALCAPSSAFADDREVLAYSLDENQSRTFYYTTDAAISAGYEGKEIYLAVDWMFTGTMTVNEGKSITINLNGYKITSQGGGEVIEMEKKSSLTLKGYNDDGGKISRNFSYKGYDPDTGDEVDETVENGGLITGGWDNTSDNGGTGGICMRGNTTLTLDNVAVAGNYGSGGGGIWVEANCNIYMKNGATIEHNKGAAGGINVQSSDCNLYMNGSFIRKNYGTDKGGGLYSYADATRIYMTNESAISDNFAKNYGGGVCFWNSYFCLVSDDNSGKVTGNKVTSSSGSGGGVYICRSSYEGNEGSVRGIEISGNKSASGAAGVFVGQEYVHILNCDIKNNASEGGAAGGVHIDNDDNIIEGCTITGNSAGKSEGGGLFVSYMNDVELRGTCAITGNVRSDKSASDVYLQRNVGTSAYIKGGVEEGSSVGIRTSQTGSAQIGKNITTYVPGVYFMNMDDYYITHGSDHGGDLWQRQGTKGFSLKVNGESTDTSYKYKAQVSVSGASSNENKAFWYWDEKNTTGLSPFSDYVKDIYSSAISFAMPQNDVDLAAVYIDKTKSASFYVEPPVAGQALSATGEFVRTGTVTGYLGSLSVPITWYEVDEKGNKTVATGNAKYGTTYVASTTINQEKKLGLFFSKSLSMDSVTVYKGADDKTGAAAASVQVDATETSATIETAGFQTESAAITAVDPASVSVDEGASVESLLAMLPDSAKATLSDGTAASLSTDKSGVAWPEGLVEDGKVGKAGTYTVSLPLKASGSVSDVAGKSLAVTVTVNEAKDGGESGGDTPGQKIETPTLSFVEGTYYASQLDEDGNLSITVSGASDGVIVKYRINDGEEQVCSSSAIVLAGKADGTAEYRLEVWAVAKDGKSESESEHVTGTYILDDTQNKAIKVLCSDTGLYAEGAEHWSESFVVTGSIGSAAVIAAPAQDGRIFDHWVWDGAPEGTDLGSSSLSIPSFSTGLSGKITAVYTPVVSTIDVGIDAPEAHKTLDAAASYVKIGVGSEGATTDVTGYFSSQNASGEKGAWLSWAPDDGTAGHNSIYTASLSLSAPDSEDGVKYALADSLTLLVGGYDVSGGAYVAEAADGGKTLCVDFPSTGPYECTGVAAPSDVQLSFGEAYGCQATQDTGKSAGWGLPKQVQVTYACGETAMLDVAWDAVTGFDKDRLEAQELTATGTVSFPGTVDNGEVSSTVTAKILVAAPETVSAPTASVASGTYKQDQSVSLSCDTDRSVIRYTTDGSEPTEESAEYGEPIQVATGTTVKARAYRSGMAPSDVATFEYSIERTVTFDTGDGSAVESQTIADGCTVQRPADPTRKGLQFKGWADAEGDAYDFDSPVTSDLTLYAQWTDAAGVPMTDLVVTFDSAGGSAVDSQYVPRGETAQKPVDPTNGGFKFDGWYLEDGTAYDFSAPVTGDLTLRAQWSGSDAQPTVAYEVTFDTAGGSAVANQTIAEGGTVTKPTDPTQEGFTFDGWTLEDGNPYDFDSPVTSSFTLYASWTASDEPAVFAHVVTFDSAGGTAVADQVVGDGGTVKRPEDPTQEGWTFGGWYLENGDLYDFASAVTGDLTLYAHWSTGGEPVSACLVTFDSSPGSEVTAQTVRVGGTVKKPADPVFAGFKFDGWYLEGGTTAYDFSSPVTSSLTLYAKWSASSEPAYSFQVTFDAGEGIAIDAQTVAAGGTVTRPADPVKEGSTFAGWLTENGTLYDFDSPVNSSFTLYAKWAASGGSVPAHVVTFDSAGGTAVADQVVGDGETVRKPDNPTQEGFAFDCWVDENGTTAYDFSSPVTTDLTLYAVWSVSSEPVFAHIVIFDSDGGSVVNSQTVGDGGTATRPADPVREGYTFAGWFLEDGAAYDFALPVSGDVKLVAKWEKNPVAPSEEDDGSGAMAPVDSDAPGSDEDAALEGGEPDGMPSATPETGDGASTAVAAVAALASLCAILVARSARQRRRS